MTLRQIYWSIRRP